MALPRTRIPEGTAPASGTGYTTPHRAQWIGTPYDPGAAGVQRNKASFKPPGESSVFWKDMLVLGNKLFAGFAASSAVAIGAGRLVTGTFGVAAGSTAEAFTTAAVEGALAWASFGAAEWFEEGSAPYEVFSTFGWVAGGRAVFSSITGLQRLGAAVDTLSPSRWWDDMKAFYRPLTEWWEGAI